MKLICFDMDNTLIRSNTSHAVAFNKALEKYGFKKMNTEQMGTYFGRPKEEVVKAIAGNVDKKTIRKIIDYHDRILFRYARIYNRKIKGVEGVLKFLKKKYKLGIVSNCKHSNIKTLLSSSDLDYKLFDVLVGNDDVKHSKPYPDEIFKAEKLLHVKAECIVGDSIYDIRAGKKAKVKTVAVLSGIYTRDMLRKEKPDYILKDIRGLKKISI
jgi:pyrophosphatase PpaX